MTKNNDSIKFYQNTQGLMNVLILSNELDLL